MPPAFALILFKHPIRFPEVDTAALDPSPRRARILLRVSLIVLHRCGHLCRECARRAHIQLNLAPSRVVVVHLRHRARIVRRRERRDSPVWEGAPEGRVRDAPPRSGDEREENGERKGRLEGEGGCKNDGNAGVFVGHVVFCAVGVGEEWRWWEGRSGFGRAGGVGPEFWDDGLIQNSGVAISVS